MHVTKNGYVAGAVLYLRTVRKLREHIEYEKFLARVLVDNEKTREFKRKTAAHPDQIYAFRYNNEKVENLTAAGRKKRASEQHNSESK